MWDDLIGIEDAGYRHVWDIHVDETEVFCPNGIACLQCQDLDPDHIPIIVEAMSHSDWGLMQLTGTPKSLDNPIEGYWARSSQAEWFVPCFHCGKWNIPSLEYDIEAMIGPQREDISERVPALLCAKCRKPINPRPPQGRWVHRYQDRRMHIAGYHVPQIVMPLHCMRPDKWSALLNKRETTAPNVFYNEVLGESVDVGQKLVTETELRRACCLPWQNNPQQPDPRILELLSSYQTRVLTIDWGGGGEAMLSFTAMALMGMAPGGTLHVLWGKRLRTPNDHMREAVEVIHWAKRFGCTLLAHDYSGAGSLRETILVQAGFEAERVMAFDLKRAASGNLIRYVPPTPLHQRPHYLLDKARSYLYTCQAIKLQAIQFFQYDHVDHDNPGLVADFLALVEEKVDSRYAGPIYTITRNPLIADDFASAIVLGSCALWHANGAWPDFAKLASLARITPAMLEAAGSGAYGWENDPKMDHYRDLP